MAAQNQGNKIRGFRMNDDSVELKPCPFCGGPAKVHRQMDVIKGETKGYFVNCNKKGCPIFATTRVRRKKTQAITEWNTRNGQ